MKKPNIETVKAVRTLLSDPRRWHKDDYTNVPWDQPSDLIQQRDNPEACFCLLGAAYACGDIGDDAEFLYATDSQFNELLNPCLSHYEQAKDTYGGFWTPAFNDSDATTHEDVLKVLDCTIKRLEGEAT
jgi:hypothetical protein